MIPRKPYLLRAMLDWAEDNGLTPLVSVDATIEGVQVPASHVSEGRITLNVLYSAMHQREVTNEALTGHARFGGRSEFLYVPMDAVTALIVRETGEGMVFPDDTDAASVIAAAAKLVGATSEDKLDEKLAAPPGLRAVKSSDPDVGVEGAEKPSQNDDPDDQPPRPPRGRPQLKVVK